MLAQHRLRGNHAGKYSTRDDTTLAAGLPSWTPMMPEWQFFRRDPAHRSGRAAALLIVFDSLEADPAA